MNQEKERKEFKHQAYIDAANHLISKAENADNELMSKIYFRIAFTLNNKADEYIK